MPLAIAFRIERFDVLPSTQAELRRRLERGERVDGLVVRAAQQSQGRGRRDRVWASGPGGSYQSLAVRDPGPPRLSRGGSAVAVAVGLAETLRAYGVQLQLKWPNDLFYRGGKLGGILTEYVEEHLLVGVGVNVGNVVPDGAAALRGWNVEDVHGAVLEGVQRGLEAWLDAPERLPERFERFDALAGATVDVARGRAHLRGVAHGIDGDGCLLLERVGATGHAAGAADAAPGASGARGPGGRPRAALQPVCSGSVELPEGRLPPR